MAKQSEVPQLDLSSLSVEDAIAALNKKYGKNSFVQASRAIGTKIRYISTGIYALDFALGGGIPENRITELWGQWSSFKSTVLLLTIANFQRIHVKGIAFIIDLERTFDRDYAERLGVDLKRLFIADPDNGEQSVDQLNDLLEIKVPLLVGIDSLAAMRPTKEVEAQMSTQFMGAHARLVGRAMTAINPRLKRNLYEVSTTPVTVIVLNQVRATMDQYAPEITPGGKAKEFYYSVIVRLSATNTNEVSINKTVNGVTKKIRVSQLVTFKVKKNKTAGPKNAEGSFTFYERASGLFKPFTVDNLEPLLEHGLFYKIIQLIPQSKGPSIIKYKKLAQAKKSVFIAKLAALPEEEIEELYFDILDAIHKSLQQEEPDETDVQD